MARLSVSEMTKRFGSKTNVSNEENDVNININADVDGEGENDNEGFVEEAEALDTSDTPETAELDVQDSAAEVNESIDETEEVSETIDGLENIYLSLAQMSVEGLQLDGSSAILLHGHVNQLAAKYGLTSDEVGIASVEDITLYPNNALTDSMEGIMDSISAIGNKITETMSDVGFKIANFAKALFNSIKATKDKTNRLRQIISAGSSKEKKVVKVGVNLPVRNSGLNIPVIEDLANVTRKITENNLAKAESVFVMNVEQLDNFATEVYYEDVLKSVKAFANKDLAGNVSLKLNDEDDIIGLKPIQNKNAKSEITIGKDEALKLLDVVDDLMDVVEGYKNTQKYRTKLNKTAVAAVKKDQAALKTEDMGLVKRVITGMRVKRKVGKDFKAVVGVEIALIKKCIEVANATNNVVAKVASRKSDGSNAE